MPVEKTFDNYDEYRSFMWWDSMFSWFLNSWNSFFDSYLDNFFDRKLALWNWEQAQNNLPVDLSKYEEESKKIDMSEKEKERRKQQLESAKTRLSEYKDKFQKSGKKDLLKDLETDMKKIEDELKSLS